jgi:hypothetical protein
LPARNEADVDDIPEDTRNDLQIIFVSRISEVIDGALEVLVAQPPPSLPAGMERQGGMQPTAEPISVKGK